MRAYRFSIAGTPEHWRRVRSFGKRRFTDPKTAAGKSAIALAARRVVIEPAAANEPVALSIEAVYPRPKRRPTWCPREVWSTGEAFVKPTRADLDNHAKLIMDALSGVAYVDDGQVCMVDAVKMYAGESTPPATTVGISIGW